jgi:hypothetical protein
MSRLLNVAYVVPSVRLQSMASLNAHLTHIRSHSDDHLPSACSTTTGHPTSARVVEVLGTQSHRSHAGLDSPGIKGEGHLCAKGQLGLATCRWACAHKSSRNPGARGDWNSREDHAVATLKLSTMSSMEEEGWVSKATNQARVPHSSKVEISSHSVSYRDHPGLMMVTMSIFRAGERLMLRLALSAMR